MVLRSRLRTVAWMSSLLQGISAFVFHGFVLCVGPEGHAAVEWLTAGDCCPPPATATAVNVPDCRDCTDAPLLQPFADKRGGDRLGAVSLRLPPLPPAVSAACRHAPRALAPPDDLVARQLVVLQL